MMSALPPTVAADGRYNISQAARALGLSRDTIYRYMRLGLLATHVHAITGARYITGKEIRRFWNGKDVQRL